MLKGEEKCVEKGKICLKKKNTSIKFYEKVHTKPLNKVKPLNYLSHGQVRDFKLLPFTPPPLRSH